MPGSTSCRFALVLIALILLPFVSYAQQPSEVCPWLNAATAAGILGQEVRVTVTRTSHAEQPNGAPFDATCDFTPLNGSALQSIQITVHTMQNHKQDYAAYLARCTTLSKPLVGVGNEAIACRADNNHDQVIEKVIGRIRERVFIFTWSLPNTEASRSKEAAQAVRDQLQNIAEQIAGSLF